MTCDELRKDNGERPLRHMLDKECRSCALFLHTIDNPLPQGTELAWAVYLRLNSPAVRRFNLQGEALASLRLALHPSQIDALISSLDAILDGVRAADEILKERERAQASRGNPRSR